MADAYIYTLTNYDSITLHTPVKFYTCLERGRE